MATISLKGDDGSVARVISRPPVIMKIDGDVRGPAGKEGQVGATPTITIGTVTTLPVGSTASVTLGGTPTNPVLNFALPRGGDIVSYTVTAAGNAQAGLTGSNLPSLTGAVNGTNKVFITPDAVYAEGTLEVYLNGVLQVLGDAILQTNPANGTFTFVTAPDTGDQLYVRYQTQEVDTLPGGGTGGVSESYVQNYVQSAFDALIANYPNNGAVQNMLADRQTALQVRNAIEQFMVAYQANTAFKVYGGNDENYLKNTVPFGTDADWAQVGAVLANANGSLWFKSAIVADTPTNPDNTPYDSQSDLLLAKAGFFPMYMNAQNVPGDNASPNKATSGAFAKAMTMAVLAKDRGMYTGLRTAIINKMQRKNTFSGQSTILYSFGSEYDITNDTTTNWNINIGDNLQILGAAIRAWNLWGEAADRELASGMSYDLKNYFVNTDEGRAYLIADTAQKTVTNGHHNVTGGTVFAVDLSAINPVIFRMARTFTGDTVFDNLLAGYYDIIAKAQNSSTGLFPHYVGYKTTDHTIHAVVNGQNGWTSGLSYDMDLGGFKVIGHLYGDYKSFNEPRALSRLTGPLNAFLKATYDSNSLINTVYSLNGTAQNSFQDAFTYRMAYLSLSLLPASASTAATIKANKIPYPTSVDGNNNHYFTNVVKGQTAASTRDGDLINWIAESMISAIYPDLAVYGSNPNAGTTAPPGTTPIDQGGGGGVTTPPDSTNGIPVGAWYSYGAAPNLTDTQRKTIAKGEYSKFKALCFVNYHCNQDGTNQQTLPNGQYRVMNPFDQFNSNQSGLRACVSEGIGYGMLATAFYGNPNLASTYRDSQAQMYFDGFWKYYKRYMNQNGLMNWCIKSDGSVNGTGGASDGDFDVAFALVMAHRIWGSAGAINYGQEATTLIKNILNFEFVPLSGFPNPNYMTNGDQWGFNNPTYFQDYFRPAWFREFYKHTGDTRWLDIINVNYPIAVGLFYTANTTEANNINGLTTDITREGKRAGEAVFGYNSIRYPFSIAADWLWNGTNGNTLARDILDRMVARVKVKNGTNPVAPFTGDLNQDGTRKANPYSGQEGIVAEPSIDYNYWRGNYRNASYVQAYGMAGVTNAAHSQWAADCMTWLANDTEPNYFGRSLSCISTAFMAAIAQPGTPTTTGTTTPGGGTTTPTPSDPVVVTPPTTNQPVGQYSLYAHQGHQIHNYIATLPAGQKKTRLGYPASVAQAFWSGIEWDPQCQGAKSYIDMAVAQGKVAQVLSYSIPGRDLGLYSAGGASNRAAYETWIGYMVQAIGNRQVILAYEPDSLPGSDSLPEDLKVGRWSMMKWAVYKIKNECPNVWLYIDCGHPAWRSVQDAANLLHQVGIEKANGFVFNVSNFRPDSECVIYGQQICAALNLPNARFTYDTGRNGGNPPPSWRWANPPGRQFGKLPQFGNTGVTNCDGWLWWKTVGESDGNSGDGAPNAGTFWPTYLYNDNVGDNIGTGADGDQVSTTSGMAQRPPTPGVVIQGAQNPQYP